MALSSHSLCLCQSLHARHAPALHPVAPPPPGPSPGTLGQLEAERGGDRGGPASPSPRVSGPLAGTVGGLLHDVGHPGGVGGTEELHGAPLQAHLPAALAEAGVGVDVVVVDAGGRAPPIAGH